MTKFSICSVLFLFKILLNSDKIAFCFDNKSFEFKESVCVLSLYNVIKLFNSWFDVCSVNFFVSSVIITENLLISSCICLLIISLLFGIICCKAKLILSTIVPLLKFTSELIFSNDSELIFCKAKLILSSNLSILFVISDVVVKFTLSILFVISLKREWFKFIVFSIIWLLFSLKWLLILSTFSLPLILIILLTSSIYSFLISKNLRTSSLFNFDILLLILTTSFEISFNLWLCPKHSVSIWDVIELFNDDVASCNIFSNNPTHNKLTCSKFKVLFFS